MCTNSELSTITKEVVDAALKLSPSVYQVILYGSYARGDNTSESDIDIMVIVDDTKQNVDACREKFYEISSNIGLKHDVLVSVLFRDKGNFLSMQKVKPFYRNINQEGVLLYGQSA